MIFKSNLEFVEAQNEQYEKGETSWRAGINSYSDRKEDEKPGHLGRLGLLIPPVTIGTE